MRYRIMLLAYTALLIGGTSVAQTFYFGADQSYVNEMEDCGIAYSEGNQLKDVHAIFADHGCNMVRLRIWHTPSWYDALNSGKRYGDLADVQKSIQRVKDHGMDVLLNFHLSDNWADPSKQVIPKAWESIANDIDVLEDSLYTYIYNTLWALAEDELLPEMVQIGNETNRGILLTPAQNEQWTLDWQRNTRLFNAAIRAVRAIEKMTNTEIKIALHFAAPAEVEWYIAESVKNGISDFDIIAMSYYWAWHRPTTIQEAGAVIARLKKDYPGKEVIVVETGYPWTLDNNDNAPNIISTIDPNYTPVSPETQKQWLIDLTQEVIDQGGNGVFYWEPSWVSTDCWNQWDQGSHQDHATFFDFENNLLIPGGIEFMEHVYDNLTTNSNVQATSKIEMQIVDQVLVFTLPSAENVYELSLYDTLGTLTLSHKLQGMHATVSITDKPSGTYIVALQSNGNNVFRKKIILP